MNSYVMDGKCYNVELGIYGYECGKLVVWIGMNYKGFSLGFCDDCKCYGYEVCDVIVWWCVDI